MILECRSVWARELASMGHQEFGLQILAKCAVYQGEGAGPAAVSPVLIGSASPRRARILLRAVGSVRPPRLLLSRGVSPRGRELWHRQKAWR